MRADSHILSQPTLAVHCGENQANLLTYRVWFDATTGEWHPELCDQFPKEGGFVGVNGVRNSVQRAARNLGRAALQAGFGQFTLVYNPSQGLFADLREASQDVLGAGSAAGHCLSSWLREALTQGAEIMLVGYSQGAAIVNTAVSLLRDLPEEAARLIVCAFGAPISSTRFHANAHAIGATVGYFKVNHFDPIATVVGRNARGVKSFIGSVVRAPLLFTPSHSAHASDRYFPDVQQP